MLASWGPLGRALGGLLGRLGGLLGRLEAILARLGGILGPLGGLAGLPGPPWKPWRAMTAQVPPGSRGGAVDEAFPEGCGLLEDYRNLARQLLAFFHASKCQGANQSGVIK